MHDKGYFLIRFKSKEDLHSMLYAGPHMFFGRPTLVKAWAPNFNFNDEVLRTISVWVRLPNLPLYCWTGDSLSKMGSVLGVPICADECITHQLRVSFACLLVEVDVTKPLIHAIPIEDDEGKVVEQKVLYEWTPPFCKSYNKVWHDCAKK